MAIPSRFKLSSFPIGRLRHEMQRFRLLVGAWRGAVLTHRGRPMFVVVRYDDFMEVATPVPVKVEDVIIPATLIEGVPDFEVKWRRRVAVAKEAGVLPSRAILEADLARAARMLADAEPNLESVVARIHRYLTLAGDEPKELCFPIQGGNGE